jgi:hypothetical protein
MEKGQKLRWVLNGASLSRSRARAAGSAPPAQLGLLPRPPSGRTIFLLGQRQEGAVLGKQAIGDDGVDVRVPVGKIAEGLDRSDHARYGIGSGHAGHRRRALHIVRSGQDMAARQRPAE